MMYQKAERGQWAGRVDPGSAQSLRFHQIIKFLDLENPIKASSSAEAYALMGFACDEGVQRNSGRAGAAAGPEALRQALSNLATHRPLALYDAGDVLCGDGNLERSQEVLGEKVAQLLEKKYRPILIGGGHEISWGHFRGLEKFMRSQKGKKLGILNFDAHFDLRPYPAGPHSGSSFLQIADFLRLQKEEFKYLAVGIQEASNTAALFETASMLGVRHVLSEECRPWKMDKVVQEVERFLGEIDHLYLTIDLDVFAAHLAPGVSAPALNGINPDCLVTLFTMLRESGKLLSVDLAELNPQFDLDSRTSKLAAYLIYQFLKA
jgi:formiminoglutamase